MLAEELCQEPCQCISLCVGVLSALYLCVCEDGEDQRTRHSVLLS